MTFSVHEYQHAGAVADGPEAAAALGLDPDQVFKTLVVSSDRGLAVAVVPVNHQLSLKAVGTALGSPKRVELADGRAAERSTGYVLGGISPFGQRQRLSTVIDDTCQLYDVMYVSGGRRGLELGVAPHDAVRLLAAIFAPIAA